MIAQNPWMIARWVSIQIGYSGYIIFNIFFLKEIIHLLETQQSQQISLLLGWYIVINLLYFAFLIYARHWGWGESYWQHFSNIHREYFQKFNALDNTYIENIGTGKCISIISKGMQTWTEMVLDSIQKPTKLLLSLIASIILLLGIGWFGVVIYLLLFIGVHIIVVVLNNYAIEWRNKRIDVANEYDRQMVKMIMSKFEILQNDKINKEIQVLSRYSEEAQGYVYKLNNYLIAMFSLPSLVFFIISLWILTNMLQANMSYATVISVFMILTVVKENMMESIEFFKNFTKQFYTIEKFWRLFDDAPKIKWLDYPTAFSYQHGQIHLQNISFSYGDNPVFKDFFMKFEWGKKTALVGLSGSGKTTLVKLISGFLNPSSWHIIVDGQDLSEINLQSYYQHIGYLTQEPSVFDGSILENLCYGISSDTIDQDTMDRAIKMAKCEFIYDFKDSINTQIWEKWVRLSWWQRQRLAIAKLFIKNPEIIILDEPTSALDSFSEEAIREAFETLFEWKTVFIIAHRLQTVKHADDIVVFEAGKVIERWTHKELIHKGGYYKEMLDLQSGF